MSGRVSGSPSIISAFSATFSQKKSSELWPLSGFHIPKFKGHHISSQNVVQLCHRKTSPLLVQIPNLIGVSTAVIEHCDKKSCEDDRVCFACALTSWTVLYWRNSRQEFMTGIQGRKWRRSHRGMLVTVLVSMAFSAFLILMCRTTCPRATQPIKS